MDLSSLKILSKLAKEEILVGSGLQSVNGQRSVCQTTDQLRTNQNCNGCCSPMGSVARQLSKEGAEILWKKEKPGGKTPESLIHTMWWLLTRQNGLRGRQEHHER